MRTKKKPAGGKPDGQATMGWAPIDAPIVHPNPKNCKPTQNGAEALADHLAERMAYHTRLSWRHAAASELYRRARDAAMMAIVGKEAQHGRE